MRLLAIDELKTLVEQSLGICVSIYIPTCRFGPETRQNPIRFKNAIRLAETYLEEYKKEYDLQDFNVSEFLQPVLDLDTEEFWQQQNDGLAIFLADNFLRCYRLPLEFEELVIVGDRFHLKPLLPLLTEDGEFYILALSQKDVRFFEGSRYNVNEIELEDVPKSLAEALRYDEPENSLQNRISTPKGGTSNAFQQAGSFHGQGSPDTDDNRRNILQFFHQLDDGLQKYLRGKRAPLVLVGVEYLFPIYREANTYQNLLEEGITGNPEILKPEELQEQAWQIVEPYFTQAQQEAIKQYRDLTGTGKISHDLKEVVAAAYYGRVDRLFVAKGIQQWGSFDPQNNQLNLHADLEPGDEDLLDSAAIQTILNSGTVYAVEPEQVPDAAPLAGIFRY
ncbi:hypothetical protein STA3757_13510 [Stanieria sp. NIES-3757]|nr:hypothetical protein STA3757_13510 [Stanieria sp. NIES-3757]